MCDLGQSSDWCYLPDVALIEIYKYLEDSERVAAARVCKNWLRLFETPLLWRYRCVSFGGFDAMGTAERSCRYIKRFGKHLRSLAIRFQGPTYRTVKVISQATEVFLKKLAVIANMRLKEFTLYHANMENHWHFVASKNRVVASLCRFLRRCRELEVLNLIAARLTLVDGCRILESLGRGAASKTLKLLYMEDMFQTNVIPVSISRYRYAVTKLKGLTYIYTNYNTVNGEILQHFAREQKMKTFTLTIDCDINSWVIEPEMWTYFKKQCPDTKVIFYIYASGFRHGIQHALPETVPMKEIDIIAWPAIIESRAEAQSRLCGLIHHISNVYSDTLESFSLHLDKNQPVDDEILYFLGRCYRLKHLSLFCKMSVNTVEKICQMQYDKQLNLRSLNLGVLGLEETELKYLMTIRVQLTQAISQRNNNVVITSEMESDDDEESMEEESEEEEEDEEDGLEDEDEDGNVEEENGHILGNLDGQAYEEQPRAAVVNNEDDGNEDEDENENNEEGVEIEEHENNEESNADEGGNGHIIENLDGQANSEQPSVVVNNEDEGNADEEENENNEEGNELGEENENNEENNEIVEENENEERDENNVFLDHQHDGAENENVGENGNQNDVEVNNENDGEVNNGSNVEVNNENNINKGNDTLNNENIDGRNVDDTDNVELYNEDETLTDGQQENRSNIEHKSLNVINCEPQHSESDRINSDHNYGRRFDQYYENISIKEDIIDYDTESIEIDEHSNMQDNYISNPGETSGNNGRDICPGNYVGYVEVFHWENTWTGAREDFHGEAYDVNKYFPWEDIENDDVQYTGGFNAENNEDNKGDSEKEWNGENRGHLNNEVEGYKENNDDKNMTNDNGENMYGGHLENIGLFNDGDVTGYGGSGRDTENIRERNSGNGEEFNGENYHDDDEGNNYNEQVNEIDNENIGHDNENIDHDNENIDRIDENIDHENENIGQEDDSHDGIDDSDIDDHDNENIGHDNENIDRIDEKIDHENENLGHEDDSHDGIDDSDIDDHENENIGHDNENIDRIDENIDHENENIGHEDDSHDGIDDSDIDNDDNEDVGDDEADEADYDDENEGDDEGDEEDDEDSVDDIFAQLMAETDDEEEDEDYDAVLMEDRSEDDESTEYDEDEDNDDENGDRSINVAETTDEEL